MRYGFTYIRFQIYVTLLALILGSSLFLVLNILHQNLRAHQQIQKTILLNNVLDMLVEDVRYAEKINSILPEAISITRTKNDYTYSLNDQRLVRKKDGYLYLTPAEITLQALQFSLENGLLKIILTGDKQRLERLVRR